MKAVSSRGKFITSGCPKMDWLSCREGVFPIPQTDVNQTRHKFKTLFLRTSLEALRKYPINLLILKFISQQTYSISSNGSLKTSENTAFRPWSWWWKEMKMEHNNEEKLQKEQGWINSKKWIISRIFVYLFKKNENNNEKMKIIRKEGKWISSPSVFTQSSFNINTGKFNIYSRIVRHPHQQREIMKFYLRMLIVWISKTSLKHFKLNSADGIWSECPCSLPSCTLTACGCTRIKR